MVKPKGKTTCQLSLSTCCNITEEISKVKDKQLDYKLGGPYIFKYKKNCKKCFHFCSGALYEITGVDMCRYALYGIFQ